MNAPIAARARPAPEVVAELVGRLAAQYGDRAITNASCAMSSTTRVSPLKAVSVLVTTGRHPRKNSAKP